MILDLADVPSHVDLDELQSYLAVLLAINWFMVSRDHCWRLGYSIPKVPAIIVRTGPLPDDGQRPRRQHRRGGG